MKIYRDYFIVLAIADR